MRVSLKGNWGKHRNASKTKRDYYDLFSDMEGGFSGEMKSDLRVEYSILPNCNKKVNVNRGPDQFLNIVH